MLTDWARFGTAVVKGWEKLDLTRTILTIVILVSILFAGILWDKREPVVLALVDSKVLIIIIAAGVVLSLMAALTMWLMKTAERRAEQAISALRDQVRQLYEETLRLQKVLTNTVADEREQCNQRINGVELRHAAEISYLKGQIEALQQTIRATRRRGDPA